MYGLNDDIQELEAEVERLRERVVAREAEVTRLREENESQRDAIRAGNEAVSHANFNADAFEAQVEKCLDDLARLRRIEEAMKQIDALRGEPGSFAEIARRVWDIARAALADQSAEGKT